MAKTIWQRIKRSVFFIYWEFLKSFPQPQLAINTPWGYNRIGSSCLARKKRHVIDQIKSGKEAKSVKEILQIYKLSKKK